MSDWRSDYDDIEINWGASLTAKHRALELLAWMVRNEWPAGVAEAIETWGPGGLAEADVAALREVFPEPARAIAKEDTCNG